MAKHLLYPKLRWPLDIRLESVEGAKILILNCPLGLTSEPLLLNSAIAPVVASLDGTSTQQMLLEQYSPYGLTKEILEDLIALLERKLFLAGPSYEAVFSESQRSFLEANIRPAALAGRAYSNQKENLSAEIEKYLRCGALKESKVFGKKHSLLGIVAPHIDYRRGSSCYGKVYSELSQDFDLFVILGTSHQYSRTLFQLTLKDFQTPLGILECDKDFVKRLSASYGHERSFAEEYLHKNEHSLELQMPFLSYKSKKSPRIAPILVGSFYGMLQAGRYPDEVDEYNDFVGGLKECVDNELKSGRKVCLIAGVDMAHVGKSFGDMESLSPSRMEIIKEQDMEYLKSIVAQDRRALFNHIARDGDARRVCGFPTMYTLIDLYDRLSMVYEADIIDYSQSVNFASDCAVTFSGLTIVQKSGDLSRT
jgi:AmmeMemoRadiSam system protein B